MKLKGKLALVLIVILLLIGCGKEETKLEETAELTQDVVEETETVGEENVEVAETDQAEEESEEEEKATKEQEETSDEMAEAQITTTVSNEEEFAQYTQNLDSNKPYIIIYNEKEGYIIKINNGESYHLKTDDRLFFNQSEDICSYSTNMPGKMKEYGLPTYHEIIPDYSQFGEPQDTYYTIFLKEDPYTEITIDVFLYPPVQ